MKQTPERLIAVIREIPGLGWAAVFPGVPCGHANEDDPDADLTFIGTDLNELCDTLQEAHYEYVLWRPMVPGEPS